MTRPTMIRLLSLAVAAVCLLAAAPVASAAASIGIEDFDFEISQQNGDPSLTAGAHPFEVTTKVAVETFEEEGRTFPVQVPKKILVNLPTGFAGNPTAVEACSEQKLEESGNCPLASQVGYTTLYAPAVGLPRAYFPIFNMETAPGAPAEFGFYALAVPVHLRAKVRTGEGYGVQVGVVDLPQTLPWIENTITLWGIPSDSSHDEYRKGCLTFFGGPSGGPSGEGCPTSAPRLPFLSNPTSCPPEASASAEVNSWEDPAFTTASDTIESGGSPLGFTGCDAVPFKPTATVTPGSSGAGEPTSLQVRIDEPQQVDNPIGVESGHVKDVEVDLPQGMAVNPAVADGLAGCSLEEIALSDPAPASCPAASRIGSVEIDTPLLADTLEGGVFVATQGTNPFNSLLAMYVAVADPRTGIVIKLPGKITPDPATGQLHASFEQNPQLPFESLRLKLRGGSRAPLVLPSACGEYRAKVRLSPWARPDEVVNSESAIKVTGNCEAGGLFTPGLEAGTTSPVGGAFSPFVLRVTRPDGQENLSRIETTLPKGLLAKLKGVALCSDGSAATGDCPEDTKVGAAAVGVGSGSSPLYVPAPGRAPTGVFLAGPYKGAPYSLVVKVPAQAGPFDLGTVTVRNGLYIDPVTTQITVKSDPLPQILQGIPIGYRDVRVTVDRPDFTVNPTSCAAQQVTSVLTSAAGKTATPADRFQVAGCGELGFKPRLAIKLIGGTHRSAHPALKAVLTMPKGNANVGKAVVTLPKTEFFENEGIGTICTRVRYAADNCPKGSVYGYAKAWSPLLERPLRGPVYLRSSNHTLPDLVGSLDGQIHVDLAGRIDSPDNNLRTTFWAVPDAPVSKFVLKMQGGNKSLLVNNSELCRRKPRAKAQFTGQNGKLSSTHPLVKLSCGSSPRKR